MKNIACLALLACLYAPAAAFASESGCLDHGDPGSVDHIRSQRGAFNEAIARADSQAISAILHRDVLLITGTDSDLYRGPDAQLALWQGDFARADRAVYVRTPSCIRVSAIVPVALEMGTWRGEKTVDTKEFAAGSYAAKWRKEGGHWLLESEVFATESCGGGFCPVEDSTDE